MFCSFKSQVWFTKPQIHVFKEYNLELNIYLYTNIHPCKYSVIANVHEVLQPSPLILKYFKSPKEAPYLLAFHISGLQYITFPVLTASKGKGYGHGILYSSSRTVSYIFLEIP